MCHLSLTALKVPHNCRIEPLHKLLLLWLSINSNPKARNTSLQTGCFISLTCTLTEAYRAVLPNPQATDRYQLYGTGTHRKNK